MLARVVQERNCVFSFLSLCHTKNQATGVLKEMAMVQNQWYHFGIGAPPILIGDWDVHWG